MAARDEASERTGQIVGRRLTHEGATAGSRLDDAKKLERPQRFANRGARHLELLGELPFGRELIAWTEIALPEKTLDLLHDPLVKAAAPDGLDDGQEVASQNKPLVRWSDQM